MPGERLSMPLGEAMYTMRAMRRLRPDPLPEDDLREVMEAAIRAPNGGNHQGWRFLLITDRGRIAQFAPLYREAWWAKRRDEGINGPEDFKPGEKNRQAPMRLADEIGGVPAIVLVCALRRGAGAAAMTIPATENLLLAARALGIGGTITTLHATVEERVHALFGIPDSAQIVYCVPLGYPRGRFGMNVRRPLTEVAARDRWDGPPI